MRIYFYDKTNRYIGSRELKEDETIPSNSTKKPVITGDGKEAYLVNEEWIVNDIIE